MLLRFPAVMKLETLRKKSFSKQPHGNRGARRKNATYEGISTATVHPTRRSQPTVLQLGATC